MAYHQQQKGTCPEPELVGVYAKEMLLSPTSRCKRTILAMSPGAKQERQVVQESVRAQQRSPLP